MKLIRNMWYGAVWSDHLTDTPLGRRIVNKPIVLFRGKDGAARAMDDVCPHRFVPLSLGQVRDGIVRCGYHGLEFDGTGACVRNPHTSGRIPPAARVRTYPAVERHRMVWLWLGEGTPDPGLIPDFSVLDDADPKLMSDLGCIQIDANYSFIVENLLDLSHVGVLHDQLLGNAESLKADLRVSEAENGDLIVSRDMYGIPVPEMLDLLYKADGQDVDHWSDIRLMGISCLLNSIGINDAGGRRDGGTGMKGCHILTPIDERTTLYQFCAVRVNPPVRALEDDMVIRRRLSELRAMAFAEQDAPMIKAQQHAIDDPWVDTSRPALFDVDLGASRFQRRINALAAAEEAGR